MFILTLCWVALAYFVVLQATVKFSNMYLYFGWCVITFLRIVLSDKKSLNCEYKSFEGDDI